SFATAHYLTYAEKLRIAWGLACLQRAPADADPPFADWLDRHRQTPRTLDRFWGLVLTSALNEIPERIGLYYARKGFLDGFLRHRRGLGVELPVVRLGGLYGPELKRWLHNHQVELILNCSAEAFSFGEGRVGNVLPRRPADANLRVASTDLPEIRAD